MGNNPKIQQGKHETEIYLIISCLLATDTELVYTQMLFIWGDNAKVLTVENKLKQWFCTPCTIVYSFFHFCTFFRRSAADNEVKCQNPM